MGNKVKVVAIVQARMGSTRLPNKVMKRMVGFPMIDLLLARLSCAKELNQIVIATSEDPRNQVLSEHVGALGYTCFMGSENDVLDRYFHAARLVHADVVVRITGDCPLIDPGVVDQAVRKFTGSNVDYLSNTIPATYPDGLDSEVFSIDALGMAWREAASAYDREHVTPYLKNNPKFRRESLVNEEDWSSLRWTVDEASDFYVVEDVFKHFAPNRLFSWLDVLSLREQRPEIFRPNEHLIRDEGAHMGSGEKLRRRAKEIIPSSNVFFSKRAETLLPRNWPAHYCKARGCILWDLDDNQYTDMSTMGAGANTLGYGHPEVDDAVRRAVEAGNTSTLSCPEEVYLAEKLLELHPWADMVHFGRSCGDVIALAISIARAATGKDDVAVCRYQDLADLADEQNIVGRLSPRLLRTRAPETLQGTVFHFDYNSFADFEAILDKHPIGAIMIEIMRDTESADDFLPKVRRFASEHGIVLIFDECTSGFRQAFGGIHKIYGVEPDVAAFGKALGNGYAIAAVIGRREIMQAARSSFTSSAASTDRIGPSAALKTLEVIEGSQSWDTITKIGLQIRHRWQRLAEKHGLTIKHWGLPALTGFTFQSRHEMAYAALVTQEMLAKGYLASDSVYVCVEHTPEIVDAYFEALDPIFGVIKECEEGRDVLGLLKGPYLAGGSNS